MITIRCTAAEKRKLCSHDYPIMCAMMNALGHCEADCGKCKRHCKDYINWEIVSKPRKNQGKTGLQCDTCEWGKEGKCKNRGSYFYKLYFDEIKKMNKPCDIFGPMDTSSCNNCWANDSGTCKHKDSEFYKMPIEEIMKIQPHCSVYGAYEGDG